MFQNTLSALQDLSHLLECELCHKTVSDPYTHPKCCHFFCKPCLAKYGNQCPTCKIPSYTKDYFADHRISKTVMHMNELHSILGSASELNLKESVTTPNTISGFQDVEYIADTVVNSSEFHLPNKRRCSESKSVQINSNHSESNENEDNPLAVYDFNISPKGRKVRKRQIPKLSKMRLITSNNKKWGISGFNSPITEAANQPLEKNEENSAFNANDKKVKQKMEKSEISNTVIKTKDYGRNQESTPPKSSLKGKSVHSSNKSPSYSSRKKRSSLSSESQHKSKSPKSPNIIHKRNAKGETALHLAAIKGDFEMVQRLLKDGADPNAKDNAGWSPLHEACNHGFKNIVVLLLDHGAIIDITGMDNETPLHDAVMNYQIEVVRLLVSRGANTALRNSYGKTPKDLAITNDMRDALNSPAMFPCQPLTRKSLSERKKMVLLGTGLSEDQKSRLVKCAHLFQAKVHHIVTDEVTHVIASCTGGVCPRTIKFMQAVVMGKFILQFKWIEECLQSKTIIKEDDYEVQGTVSNPKSNAPRIARLNAEKKLPGLFNGCHFFLRGEFNHPSYPSKEELMELIKKGGGTILTREPKPDTIEASKVTVPFHAPSHGDLAFCSFYILYQPKSDDESQVKIKSKYLVTLPVTWLLECVATFSLISDISYYN